MRDTIFTSESVTPGHPDKLCDQISDAVVDAFLQQDPLARAVVECAIATGVLFVAARYAARATVDVPGLARSVIADAGYLDRGFDARSCSVLTAITDLGEAQRAPGGDSSSRGSKDDARFETEPAREQVNAFGFACRETASLMPLPVWTAHRVARELAAARTDGLTWLEPDGKTQVAVQYRNRTPQRIHSVTVAAATSANAPAASKVERALRERVIDRAFAGSPLKPDAGTAIHINPGGPYLLGGPAHHSGLTGRKTGIDTYGEYARQSGAALSGKDPSRIDRIGAYAARHAAKNLVAADLAERCEVHLAYSIGVAAPLSIAVDTYGTGRLEDDVLAARLAEVLDFRAGAIEQRFALRSRAASAAAGFFRPLATFGQMGREDLDVPWESTEVAARLAGR
jgi:S-adenosylmethionine synthetase